MYLVFLLGLIIGFGLHYIKRQYSYWERHGFPYDSGTTIPFGCLSSVSRREKSMGMAINDVYQRTKGRYNGIYLLFRPALLVKDVTLAKQVLLQDFVSFHDRGVYVDEKNDPLSANLFSLEGQSWKNMRTKLAPSFNPGKLKEMFPTVDEVGNRLVQHLNDTLPDEGSAEVDIRKLYAKYAIDVIASVIFGLEVDSFQNPNNKFQQVVNVARANTWLNAVVGMFIFFAPGIARLFFKLGIKNSFVLSLYHIIKETVEYREKNNVVRKDLLQLLMQLRNTGKIDEDDSNWNANSVEGQKKCISFEELASNAFIFYTAGQETTAATAAFTIFELAQYPELLRKAQDEVDNALKENNGIYSYELVKEMKFLEMCIQESLRKYPGLPFLSRVCTKDYKIPGTDDIVRKGTPIVIPIFGIQRDEQNFPEPLEYNPYRFEPENRETLKKHAFMPFGDGPRHCIAKNMGKINAKLAVAKVLHNFNIDVLPKSEIEFSNHSIPLLSKDGVKVRLSKRSNKRGTNVD